MTDLQMGQHGAAHENGDLLHDLDARVPRLPALLALAHSLQEGQQCRDAQRGRHHTERARCRVPHIPAHTQRAQISTVFPYAKSHALKQTLSMHTHRRLIYFISAVKDGIITQARRTNNFFAPSREMQG